MDPREIENPGAFPDNLEPEDYIFKNEPSVPRNPLIADGLYRTKDIEKWGSGLKRIYQECKENGIRAEFAKTNAGFKVIFHRPPLNQVPEKVTENQAKILTAITRNPKITIPELSSIVAISERKIKENISKLKKKNLLARIGPDKGGHWQVTGEKT
ncbi:MAG: ATP-binding protein [Candidatus Micrarchaeota archaeon]|nr:ATP-binding protein [Candidatus Micrarchaeota archaeon]